jgi:hypothetical protein
MRVRRVPGTLMYRASRGHARIEFDFSESAFVTDDILLENVEQGLGLLRAQIDSLEIIDFYLGLALLLQGAESEKEIPYVHPHLHAVGVVFAVFGSVDELDIRLSWVRHRWISVAASLLWTQRYTDLGWGTAT